MGGGGKMYRAILARIIIRGVPSQGGTGFGYVSDMYPSPFWYVSNSHFDIENTEEDP